MIYTTILFRRVVSLGMLMVAVACDGDLLAPESGSKPDQEPPAAPPQPEIARLVVSSRFHVLTVGETSDLGVRALDAGGQEVASSRALWRSLTPIVASVSGSGSARAEAPGLARVAVEAGSAADTVLVASLGPRGLLMTAFVDSSFHKEVSPGQTISVPVVLDLSRATSGGDLGSLQLDLAFDAGTLLFTGSTAGASGTAVTHQPERGRIRFAFAATEAQGKDLVTLVTLNFQVSPHAAAGTQRAFEVTMASRPTDTSFLELEKPLSVGGVLRVVHP
jgi:hypothetical protein